MLEYAYCKRHVYQAVFWLRANKQELLEEDLAKAAKLLEVPEARKRQPNHQYLVTEAKQWLQKHSGWLLLLDNVEEDVQVKDILSGLEHGQVLLTTRSQAVAELACNLRLDKMQPEEGTLLLLRRTHILLPPASLDTLSNADCQKTLELSLLLNGLPLALDQAGAYIDETKCSLSDYIQLYHEHRKELLQRKSQRKKLYEDYKEEDILLESTFLENAEIRPIVEGALQLNQACEVLLRYSLIRRNAAANLFSIHRLVQAVLQDSMDESTQRLWAERTVHAVEKAFLSASLERVEYYIPQARLCGDIIKQWDLGGLMRLFGEARFRDCNS